MKYTTCFHIALKLLLFAALPLAVQAQDRTWTSANGTWSVPTNWSGNTVPIPSSNAYIDNSGTARLGAGVTGVANSVTVGVISGGGNFLSVESGTLADTIAILGDSAGSNGSASVSGGVWANSGPITVGNSGVGNLLINGGWLTSASAILGGNTNGVGSVTVSSGSWTNSGPLLVGASGRGTLTVSGGLVTSSTTVLAASLGSSGTLSLTGGTLATGRVALGSGQGSLSFDGGRLQATANSASFLSGFGSGITIGSSGAFLDSNGFAVTNTTALVGTGRLTKEGLGTLTLTGSNSYTGGTTVKSGTLALDGGRISHTSSSLLVGSASGDNASLLVTNGGVLNSQGISLGDAAGSMGALTINSGTLTGSSNITVGNSGQGALTINGGYVSTSRFMVGQETSSTGVVVVNGGTLQASSMTVGYKGSIVSSLTLNGGLINVLGSGTAGYTWRGAYIINGGTFNVRDMIVRGGSTFTINGGVTTTARNFQMVNDSTLTVSGGGILNVGGTLTLASNTLSTTLNIGSDDLSSTAGIINVAKIAATGGSAYINFNQTDTYTYSTPTSGDIIFTQQGTGTTVFSGTVAPNSAMVNVYQGRLVIDGEKVSLSSGNAMNVGFGAGRTGYFDLKNGYVQGSVRIGVNGASGIMTVTGGTLVAGAILVGYSGTGSSLLTIDGGVVSSSATYLASDNPASGWVVMQSGTWTNSNTLYVGYDGRGTLDVNGGYLQAGNVIVGHGNASSGTLNLSGGLLEASQISNGAGSATFNFNGGTLRATAANANFVSGFASGIRLNAAQAVIDNSGYTIGISSVLTGTGGLTSTGTGALILSGASTYTGTTNVTAGKLQVDGGLQSVAVNVSNAATLAGSGSIAGTVTIANGGTLAPGSTAPGTLTTGALTLNDTSVLNFKLSTPNVVGGGVNDLVSVNGNLVLDGILNVFDLTGFGAGTYRLFDYTGSLTDNGLLFGIVPGAFNLTVDSSVANQINLIVTAPTAQYWDGPNATPQGVAGGNGGSGTWNAATTNWTNANGNANAAWVGTTGAVFSGSSGMVTIANGFTATAASLSFQTNGYVLAAAGSGALNLTGGNVEVATGSTTISAPIIGSALLSKSGTGTLTLTGSNSYSGGTSVRAGTLVVSGAGSISHASADLAVGHHYGDVATMVISGSASISNHIGFIGTDAGSTGTVIMGGGTWTNADELRVGDYGNGTLNVTGGAITSTIGNIARSVGSTGTVTMSGGSWTNSNLFVVGNAGVGAFALSGGALASVVSSVGYNSGGNGTATVNGGAWLNSDELRVGDSGNGTLIVTGGTLTSTIGNIARSVGSTGSVTMSGGLWTNSNQFVVGNAGSGSFTLSSGTLSSVVSSIGYNAGGSGTAMMSGGAWNNSGELRVGDSGNGVLTITGGAITSTIGNLGRGVGSSGTLAMSGGSWTNSDQFIVGNAGSGVFTLTSGTLTNNIGLIGAGGGASGTAAVSGGRWANDTSLDVGQSGAGTLTLTDTGVVSINAGSGTLTLARNASATGTLNLGAGGLVGTLQAAEVTGGDGLAQVNFNHTGSVSFSLKLTGSLALTKLGTGTLTLTSANTYAGGTKISAGTLLLTDVGSGNSVLGVGAVTVDAGAKLAGVGTVLGDTEVAGTLAPGNSPGAMQFAGALFLDSTAIVQMELASSSSYDQISVGGLLTYGGELDITLLSGYFPQIGDTFALFNAGSVAGGSQFDAVNFSVSGYDGTIDYGTGKLTITAVPEPSMVGLLALGLAVLVIRRRAERTV